MLHPSQGVKSYRMFFHLVGKVGLPVLPEHKTWPFFIGLSSCPLTDPPAPPGDLGPPKSQLLPAIKQLLQLLHSLGYSSSHSPSSCSWPAVMMLVEEMPVPPLSFWVEEETLLGGKRKKLHL